MYALGAVFVWLVLLGFTALLGVLPVLWAWRLWQGIQRRRQRPRSPYDDAYVRALEGIARRNGARDAELRLAELEA